MLYLYFVKLVLVIIALLISVGGSSQSFFDFPDTINKKRLAGVVAIETIGTAGSLLALNQVWYSQYPRSSFHLFNDNAEWLQMDKVGHTLTAYYIGYAGVKALQWTGAKRKRAIWYGAGLGLLYQTGLETLDAFSTGWGFSIGDMVANVAGTGLVVAQELLWDDQRIKMKFSAHLTDYAGFRPNALGSTVGERLLKDYNGQTYWLSFNLKSFAFKENQRFPGWLNVAIGYGATQMISGTKNPDLYCNGNAWCKGLDRHRQWYLSLDADLTKIGSGKYQKKLKSGFLKAFFGTFGFIKIPAPALEFSKNGVRLNPFYF
ncbi:MAG: hypothetical protein ACI9J3_000047 [Parvicellaceae bacterium]